MEEIRDRCLDKVYEEVWIFRESFEESPWYLAAKAGSADAQFVLGYVMLGELGHKEDKAEAVRYLRSAADQGHPHALYELAGLYKDGRGVFRSKRRAWALLHQAVVAGSLQAYYALAIGLYSSGDMPDEPEIVLWLLEKTAAGGHAESQLALGKVLTEGKVCNPDQAEAVK